MRRITTASGTVYTLDDANARVRRESQNKLRGDEQWQGMFNKPEVEVGHIMVLLINPLSDFGPDSYGNLVPDAPYTTRLTTPVTNIEEVDHV